MDEHLEQLLINLKLKKIREVLARELARAEKDGSSYTELLVKLLRAEDLHRRERSLEYRIERARIPEKWSLETFPFDVQTGVKRARILQLAELDFIARGANVVFVGETAVGKTGLATGILLKALENGYRGLFVKAQDLFDEMYSSLADRSSRRLLNRLAHLDVILIDELGYLNLRPEQSNLFFRLMEERYQRKATIITTNLEYEAWYDFLGQKKMVEALLSRLRHHCTTIHIAGPSLPMAFV
jgi:DNA replication protein DnaC